jgi:hypothetical protein
MHDASLFPSNCPKDLSIDYKDPNPSYKYSPVSLQSAATIVPQMQDLDKTIQGMAYSLIHTIQQCEIKHKMSKMEANACIAERDEKIASLQV